MERIISFWSFVFAGLIGVVSAVAQTTPAVVTLENEALQVKIKRKGAEMISVLSLEDQVEYLWQGDEITWADHAIIQFPIIGNLKDGRYRFEGEQFEMMSHGFARISDFEVVEKTEERVVFELLSNDISRKIYPFDFSLQVQYELVGKTVNVTFRVRNEGNRQMPFTLGYHPGFNCPLQAGENMEDYMLRFEKKESADRLVMRDNLIAGASKNYLAKDRVIRLNKSLFQDDAIILQGLKSSSVTLQNAAGDRSVNVDFGRVPYLGIWSPGKFGDFVCIEPWFGIPDAATTDGDFLKKAGMKQLAPKAAFTWTCRITINGK